MKHYELTAETKVWKGRTLRRIRRLADGQLGGWIESEKNLEQGSGAWVDEGGVVCDEAVVSGGALITDDARVFGRARISGTAIVRGYVSVSEQAQVGGTAQVFGYARLRGKAKVLKGYVTGFTELQ